jgi:hypothetical protein
MSLCKPVTMGTEPGTVKVKGARVDMMWDDLNVLTRADVRVLHDSPGRSPAPEPSP